MKVGDCIVARKKFLRDNHIDEKDCKFIIKAFKYLDGEYIHLIAENKTKFKYDYCTSEESIFKNDFFKNNGNINDEIQMLLDNDDIEFKSFNAVTMDGKVINMEASRPL